MLTPTSVTAALSYGSTSSPISAKAHADATDIILGFTSPSPRSRSERLLEVAHRFGDLPKDRSSLAISPDELKAAYDGLAPDVKTSLDNIVKRVSLFAQMQRQSVSESSITIPGGSAGQSVSPCRVAGCYAPGGRYPLPSSVVMTCVTAKVAGCSVVQVCSPNPQPITLAAAYISGCTTFLSLGGAQAIGALAYGVLDGEENIERCDVIVGPGNQWVTAAKGIVSGNLCGIDMLAGPSEVMVLCDATCNPSVVAADLIAQAEHDVIARTFLATTSQKIIDSVNSELARQLASMPQPNRGTAEESIMNNGISVLCASIDECVKICDAIAPEHLEIFTEDCQAVADKCSNYGGLFIGGRAAEVLGDYGAGPNHTLPTGGAGRYTGGLSVFNFLRIRTWMKCDDDVTPSSSDSDTYENMVADCIIMARCEGLEGHARAAEMRK